MPAKPVVVLFQESLSGGNNPIREALVFCIREHCDSRVLAYSDSYYLKRDSFQIRKLVAQGMLLASIVTEEMYGDGHTAVAQLIGSFSPSCPMFVIRRRVERPLDIEKIKNPVHVLESDEGVIDLIGKLRSQWSAASPTPDYFGVRTEEEHRTLCERLVAAHHANYGDDDSLGPVTESHRLLAEALRLRLLSPNIREEFDETVRRVEMPVLSEPSVDPKTYGIEFEKLRAMNDEERESFYHDLLHATGCAPAEGGVYKIEVSTGRNNYGYAIEARTLESDTSHGFGLHEYAKAKLQDRMRHIRSIQQRYLPENEKEPVFWEIVSGIIIPDFPGFKSQILMLYTGQQSPENINRVADFIRSEGKMIPVDVMGGLLGT